MTGYEYFEKVLKNKNLKAFDVSKGTGIRSGVFSDWKHGRYVPKADKMQAIADYLGVPVEPLLGSEFTEEKQIHYVDEESARIAQRIFENRALKTLFDATEDVSPEDLQHVIDMISRFNRTNSEE